MKKLYTLSTILLASICFGQTPIGLINSIPYIETFDGMGATQMDFIPGWSAINVNNNAPLTMGVTNGNAATGNIYNVGTTNATDRAFGTLADATVTPAFGAVFQNNTGNTVTKIAIKTKMEQWKESGNNAVNEKIAFSYSFDATSLSDGNWTTVPSLDLNEKLTSATTNLAVDGNLVANYTNPTQSTITLNWPDGANLWIKWTDTNDAGANGLYAIDDFILSISEILGVPQNQISGLNIYPNPVTNGTLYITSDSDETKSVVIYDILGKEVLNSATSNGSINVSNLKRGVYIAKISEDGKTDTKKIVIQ